MRTLYLECLMGAAGDMLMAALLELIAEPDAFIEKMNGIGLSSVRLTRAESEKCGITGTHISVLIDGAEEDDADHKSNRGLGSISELIEGLNITNTTKKNAIAVYEILAAAESHVHGKAVTDIHFHEVGTLDAIADIVGVCMLMEELAADEVIASPVHVGSGQVRCMHGVLPVPAPATAHILRDIPTYGGKIAGELCTPTGAALLKHFCSDFGERPVMTVSAVGYGMGKKNFEAANCVRAFLGDRDSAGSGMVAELSCNLDDMTGETIAFAMEVLLENSALDVYTTPIMMKKGRPGIMLSCICKTDDADRLAELMLRHTTTFGVRKNVFTRYTLERSYSEKNTKFGEITLKTGYGYGTKKVKAEFETVAIAARAHNVSIQTVYDEL